MKRSFRANRHRSITIYPPPSEAVASALSRKEKNLRQKKRRMSTLILRQSKKRKWARRSRCKRRVRVMEPRSKASLHRKEHIWLAILSSRIVFCAHSVFIVELLREVQGYVWVCAGVGLWIEWIMRCRLWGTHQRSD